jgi:hypothetical protein
MSTCTCGHDKTEHKTDGCTALMSSSAGHHGGPELQYCVCRKFTDREKPAVPADRSS